MRKKTTLVLGWIFHSLVFCSPAMGQESNFSFEPRAEVIHEIPTRLFHWVSKYHLHLWSLELESRGEGLLFPHALRNEGIAPNAWKYLKRTSGIFTWINPVLAAQSNNMDIYATERSALVMFDINPNAKAIRLVSKNDGYDIIDHSEIIRKSGIKMSEVQLVEHITPHLKEWIIISPKAVKQFTADPRVTHPILRDFIRPLLESPTHLPHSKEVHYSPHPENGGLPYWYTRGEKKNKWVFNERLFKDLLVRLEVIQKTTPGSPYFDKKLHKERLRFESHPALLGPLPSFFIRPRFPLCSGVF